MGVGGVYGRREKRGREAGEEREGGGIPKVAAGTRRNRMKQLRKLWKKKKHVTKRRKPQLKG